MSRMLHPTMHVSLDAVYVCKLLDAIANDLELCCNTFCSLWPLSLQSAALSKAWQEHIKTGIVLGLMMVVSLFCMVNPIRASLQTSFQQIGTEECTCTAGVA